MNPFTCQISVDCAGQILVFQFIMNSVRYFPIAGLVFLILWIIKKQTWKGYQIQDTPPGQVKHEIYSSWITLFVFIGVAFTSTMLGKLHVTQTYFELGKYPLWYLPLSFGLLTVWHETWFYWMHRAIHTRLLYKVVHLAHHKSVNPSPFAAYSFSAFEAFGESIYIFLFLLVVPLHPIVILTQAMYAMIMNIWWHSGYEVFPSGFTTGRFTKWINTSTHHNMHHSKVKANFSLYFNFWDRILGTNHPDYDSYFESVVAKRKTQSPITTVSQEVSSPSARAILQ